MTARQRHHASPVWDTRTPVLVPDVSGKEFNWVDFALCAEVDGEIFFPEQGGTSRYAKQVCMACEVRAECLDYALANEINHGVWGGKSERERRKIRQRQEEAA